MSLTLRPCPNKESSQNLCATNGCVKNLAVADGSAVIASDSSGKNSMRIAATSRAAWPCGRPLQCSHWVLSCRYFSVLTLLRSPGPPWPLKAANQLLMSLIVDPWMRVLASVMICCLLHSRREFLCLSCRSEPDRISALPRVVSFFYTFPLFLGGLGADRLGRTSLTSRRPLVSHKTCA